MARVTYKRNVSDGPRYGGNVGSISRSGGGM